MDGRFELVDSRGRGWDPPGKLQQEIVKGGGELGRCSIMLLHHGREG